MKEFEDFPFDEKLLSCRNKGVFPDLAIRISHDDLFIHGGELIELKDSVSYSISSFNSTIPSGKKSISSFLTSKKSKMKEQMIEAGDDPDVLPERDVYYLVRGRYSGRTKVALVHGSFFETIRIDELISESFLQVLEEHLRERGAEVDEKTRELLRSIFTEQENFSKVRDVEKSSVKLRFRIMTEVKAEGNILNSSKYPEIVDDSLNFVLPFHNVSDEHLIVDKMKAAFGEASLDQFVKFKIKHHLNGWFLVFQISLT